MLCKACRTHMRVTSSRVPICTHLHNPSAALDAFAAFAGVKSGWLIYFSRMRSMICIQEQSHVSETGRRACKSSATCAQREEVLTAGGTLSLS
eukprot:1158225-Pelagomonas_calceolata.AAC.5